MKFSDFIRNFGNAYDHPVTLVNTCLADQTLVYVNQAFLDVSQYPLEEIIGKNCRFLQGAGTDRNSVTKVRMGISAKRPVCQDLLNYRKNEEAFYNRLVLIPFSEDQIVFYIGLQHEISASMFSPDNIIDDLILYDKLINPMTAIVSSLQIDPIGPDELKIKHLNYFHTIRNFILNL